MIEQPVRMREFQTADLEAVHRLIHHVVNVSYSVVYPEGALTVYRGYHSLENISDDTGKGYCVVAENERGIVGTGILLEANIRRVYVDPDCQNSGIGKKIYEMLENRAIQLGIPVLDLSASLVARDFWERRGFTVQSEDSIPFGGDKLVFFTMTESLSAVSGERKY
jgi:GNAT superfamily N-acetyltransferase